MHKQLRLVLCQRCQRKFHAALEYLSRLWLKIIVHRIPANGNSVRHCQRRVVELNLHVDDVRNPRARCPRHFVCVPYSAANRNPVGHPRYVHPHLASCGPDISVRPNVSPNSSKRRNRRNSLCQKYMQQIFSPRSHPRRNRQCRRSARLSRTPTPALHSTASPLPPGSPSPVSTLGSCFSSRSFSGSSSAWHAASRAASFKTLVIATGGSSSSRTTGSVGNPIRVSSVCASDPTTCVGAVSSVAGYNPTASNRYFAVASCPVFATVITPAAINSAESTTRLSMFFRTCTLSLSFFSFVARPVALLLAGDFFAALVFAFAFFLMLTAHPPQNLGGAGLTGLRTGAPFLLNGL